MTTDEALDYADSRRLSALEGGCTAAAAVLLGLVQQEKSELDKHFRLLCMDAWAQHLNADADALSSALAAGFDTGEGRSRVLLALESLRVKATLELFMRQKETLRRGAAKTNARKQKNAAKLDQKILKAAEGQRRKNGSNKVQKKLFYGLVAQQCDCSPRRVESVLSRAKR